MGRGGGRGTGKSRRSKLERKKISLKVMLFKTYPLSLFYAKMGEAAPCFSLSEYSLPIFFCARRSGWQLSSFRVRSLLAFSHPNSYFLKRGSQSDVFGFAVPTHSIKRGRGRGGRAWPPPPLRHHSFPQKKVSAESEIEWKISFFPRREDFFLYFPPCSYLRFHAAQHCKVHFYCTSLRETCSI